MAPIAPELNLDHRRLLAVRDGFQLELQKTMRHEPSSLKNEPYGLPPASGHETGLAATLDLGGTHVRAHLIELPGHGAANWLRTVQRPLRSPDLSSATRLFDLQARTLAALLDGLTLGPIPLGYVFSFIVSQPSLNQAVLTRWTKELNTPGVEGKEVVGLLKAALVRQKLDKQIIPTLVMNDTIGTFMASAYLYPDTSIGSVIGTGFNTGYLQPGVGEDSGAGKIINLECGNFDKVPATCYDDRLDRLSSFPGMQRLEKMVSGHYLGELFRLILSAALAQARSGPGEDLANLSKPYSIDSSELSTMIGDDSLDLHTIQQWGLERLALPLSADECCMLQRLAVTIAQRSAGLVAATYAAILNHVDPLGTQNHIIGINGSLYEKMPGYKEWLSEKLQALLPPTLAHKVSIRFCAEGPALGAAVAVCRLEHQGLRPTVTATDIVC